MGKEVLIDQPKDPKQSTARRFTNALDLQIE
jgi:hypothetical protein